MPDQVNRPARLVNMPAPGTDVSALLKKHNEVLARIAAKLAGEYNIKYGSDFRIKFQNWKRHAFRCRKFGSVVGIYFNVGFNHPEFEYYLRQALLAAQAELASRPLPELASRLREREREHKEANPWVAEMPKLISKSECDVTELYVVEVKHKRTGLVVRKESKTPYFSRMVYDAREDLTEQLMAVDEAREREEARKIEQTLVDREEFEGKDRDAP